MSSAQTSRRVAFETIHAVNESDAYANLLLPTAISRAGLSTADAALATELTYGTLRRQGTYDAIIALAADRDVDEIDSGVLDALRLGVHQLLSTRVASHAAVNESVELARSAGSRGAAGFTNAVLRRVSRDTPGEWMSRVADSARSDDERLGLVFSHPVWVVRAFRRALAAEGRAAELEALLTADNASPRVTMAALPGIAEVPDDARRTPYSPFGFRLGGGDPERLVRESGGTLRVQDEGSQVAALALTRALPIGDGERWLDLCAGPGGKTAVLAAEALAHGAHLEANEVSPARAGETSFASRCAPCASASAARTAVLPPGPAHRSSHRSPSPIGRARVRARAATCDPSSCTRSVPPDSRTSRSGSPPPSRKPNGEYGVRLASSGTSAMPGSAAIVTRGDALSAVNSASSSAARPSAARARRKARTTHTGCEKTRPSRSSSERALSATRLIHSPGVSRDTRRRTAFVNPAAPRLPALRASSTDSFTAACEATRVESS